MKYLMQTRDGEYVLSRTDVARYCTACSKRMAERKELTITVAKLHDDEPDATEAILQAAARGDELAKEVATALGITPKRANTQRTIKALANGAQVTYASFEGRKHMVVPIVALREGVVFPSTSAAPEFVPAEVLARSVQGWNGEPVMADHPKLSEGRVTANTPEILEKQSFGRVFDARMDGEALTFNAYIDPTKAPRVDGAEDMITRMQAGETVDVSIGAFVMAEELHGSYEGKEFFSVWREIMPDHLAILPAGTEGACSVDMGCGAPRTAAKHLATQQGGAMQKAQLERIKALLSNPRVARGNDVVSTLLAMSDDQLKQFELAVEKKAADAVFSKLLADGLSDTDIRMSLEAALAPEAGYLGIESVFMDDGNVVYAVMTGETVKFYQRSFEMNEDGTASIGGEALEVMPVTRFEPVAAASGRSTSNSQPAKETQMNEKRKKLEAIIASGKTTFTAADLEALEGLSDASIAALENSVQETPKVEPTVEPAPTEVAGLPLAEAEVIVKQHQAAQAKRKSELIAQLSKQDVFTTAELETRSVDDLEKLAKLATLSAQGSAVDQAGRGLPAPAQGTETIEEPPDLRAAVLAARKAS